MKKLAIEGMTAEDFKAILKDWSENLSPDEYPLNEDNETFQVIEQDLKSYLTPVIIISQLAQKTGNKNPEYDFKNLMMKALTIYSISMFEAGYQYGRQIKEVDDV